MRIMQALAIFNF